MRSSRWSRIRESRVRSLVAESRRATGRGTFVLPGAGGRDVVRSTRRASEARRSPRRRARGQSGALVLRGQPGVGKSALLDDAVEAAQGFTVARAVGVESEMELPFAALHQLFGSMVDRIERLPPPQAGALGVVFGLHTGDAPDRFIVG